MDNHLEENTSVEQLINLFATFAEEATDTVEKFLASDLVQDATTMTTELGESLSDAVKGLKLLKSVASIPSKLYLRKFEKFCRGLAQIPLEKRQKYMKTLGREKFNRESVFILNVINRIEEEDKFPLLIKLLDARTAGILTSDEYRRLTVLVDRTFYSDLLYLEHNITADPVALHTDSDYGLVASGLLVTAGNDWGDDLTSEDDPNDTGIRFNYTSSAKKLAQVLFGVCCDENPTNKGVVRMQPISTEEIDRICQQV